MFALLVAACSDPDPDVAVDAAEIDAPAIDAAVELDAAPPPRCQGSLPFTAPTAPSALSALNTAGSDSSARLSPDELTVYYVTDGVIMTSTRGGPLEAFPTPVPLVIPGVAATDMVGAPSPTADGRTLYFTRQDSANDNTIWRTTRPAATGDFGTATQVSELDLEGRETAVYVVPDESAIYFSASYDIYRAARLPGGTFATPIPVSGIDADGLGLAAVVSRDELTAVFFTSDVSEGSVTKMVVRPDAATPFAGEITLDSLDGYRPSWISPDGCRLYIFGGGSNDILVTSRNPP